MRVGPLVAGDHALERLLDGRRRGLVVDEPDAVGDAEDVGVDGDGGDPPVITTEPLQANTDYTAALRLLNETETPPEEITEEVEAEDCIAILLPT